MVTRALKSRAPVAPEGLSAAIGEKARRRRGTQRALTEISAHNKRERRNDLAPPLRLETRPTDSLKPASRQVRRREIQQSEESDSAPVARRGRDQRTITEGPPSSINRLYVRGYYVVEALFVNELAREYLPWNLDFEGNQIQKPETWSSLSHREWKGNIQYYCDKDKNVLGGSEFEIFKDYRVALMVFSKEDWWRGFTIAGASKTLYAINDVDLADGCDGDALLKLIAGSVLLKKKTWLSEYHPSIDDGFGIITEEDDKTPDQSSPSSPKPRAREGAPTGKRARSATGVRSRQKANLSP